VKKTWSKIVVFPEAGEKIPRRMVVNADMPWMRRQRLTSWLDGINPADQPQRVLRHRKTRLPQQPYATEPQRPNHAAITGNKVHMI
jgi:hypothetical protein